MGYPVEMPEPAGPELAHNVAAARAGQIRLRLRAWSLPATTSDDVREERRATIAPYQRRIDAAAEIEDPHARLAAFLALGEDLVPVMRARDGGLPDTASRWLEWALMRFREPYDERAYQAQEGGQ
jgi:hypothetical protein